MHCGQKLIFTLPPNRYAGSASRSEHIPTIRMPRECPPAFRSAPAGAGTGSAKRRSVRPPIAIAPVRCHVRCCASLERGRYCGHADLAELTPRHNHGRPIRSPDDAVGVPALSLQAWDGINQCERLLRVVTIGSGQLNGERNSPCVADQMTFAAQLGPVSRVRSGLPPQKLPRSNCRPRRPATNQSPRNVTASPATRSGSVARCPPLASHVAFASMSCQNRSPVPAAASPMVFRYAGRTEFP
jgi:hypothetical protein